VNLLYTNIQISIIFSVYYSIFFLSSWQTVHAQTVSEQVRERLRNRIEAGGMPLKITVGEESVFASIKLPTFYLHRIYAPAWSKDKGPLPLANKFLLIIRQADQEGLDPDDYHLAKIESVLAEIRQSKKMKNPPDPGRLSDLDLLLTDAFLIYSAHMLSGRINPETMDPEWHANRREADLAEILQNALDSNEIEKSLKNLLPRQAGYARLRKKLAQYRKIAADGGWVAVSQGPKLQKGDRNGRVMLLRERLFAEGDVERSFWGDEDHFDETLETGVRHFQERNGLDVDGVVGPQTLESLNVTAHERVLQIALNMERWRWLPQDLGDCHILVNIAGFNLAVVENDHVYMDMRIVSGKSYRRTPVFSGQMTYVVLNPSWNVPYKLAVQDKLPLIKENVGYLAEQGMRVYQGWGAETMEIDPHTIDWSQISPENFSFRLRQDPGPKNALGHIKFMFPNKFDVYLHDTPSKDLFEKAVRTFSSGCIRIEKPVELAEFLLQDDPEWRPEKIQAALEKGEEKTVRLPKPIPIHLLYWTAWVDEKGTVHFRKDIYGRDKRLDDALRTMN